MGKGTIQSEQGAGEYIVRVNYNATYANNLITLLTNRIADLTARLPDLQTDISTALAGYNQAISDLTAAIAANDEGQIRAAVKKRIQAGEILFTAQGNLQQVNLEIVASQRYILTLQTKLQSDHNVTAWCADYTEGLTGEIGLVEIARIEDSTYTIYPNGVGTGSQYLKARDGQLTPTISQTAEQVFWNYAMLPGFNTWRPRYRRGIITDVDTVNNTVDIDLDITTSTHQAINVNQSSNLSSVPANYMSTGADLYEIGDDVIVFFGTDPSDPTGGTSWTDPHVLGFVREPKLPPTPGTLSISGPDIMSNGSVYNILGGIAPYFLGIAPNVTKTFDAIYNGPDLVWILPGPTIPNWFWEIVNSSVIATATYGAGTYPYLDQQIQVTDSTPGTPLSASKNITLASPTFENPVEHQIQWEYKYNDILGVMIDTWAQEFEAIMGGLDPHYSPIPVHSLSFGWFDLSDQDKRKATTVCHASDQVIIDDKSYYDPIYGTVSWFIYEDTVYVTAHIWPA